MFTYTCFEWKKIPYINRKSMQKLIYSVQISFTDWVKNSWNIVNLWSHVGWLSQLSLKYVNIKVIHIQLFFRLLVHLKSIRNTVPVPRHWCFKRKYLQGKRGIEKPPFDLPEFIKKTGIMEMRAALQVRILEFIR